MIIGPDNYFRYYNGLIFKFGEDKYQLNYMNIIFKFCLIFCVIGMK